MTGLAPFRVLRSGLVTWLVHWYGWVPLCILWVLCWVTVVLGPPATFAIVYGANASVHGILPNLRTLAAEGKRYFWLSWAWMGMNLLAAAFLWAVHFLFQRYFPQTSQVSNWVIGIAAFLWWTVQFYTLPYLIIQDRKNLWIGLRNGGLAVFSAPFYTLILAGAGLLLAGMSLVLVAPLVLGGPALAAVLANEAALQRLKTFHLLDD